MNNLKRTIRQFARSRGCEVRQFDPDISLDTYLWALFKHYKINCVLDVGARYGDYGLALRNNNFKGHIISFEPIEENFQRLERRSKEDPLWRAHRYALGSQNQSSVINVSQVTSFSSFHALSEYGKQNLPHINMKHTETVEVHRLDDIFSEVTSHIKDPRIYLKIDTQGWDIEVLRGSKNCLDHILALQSEISLRPLYDGMPDWMTAINEFKANGFAVSALFRVWRDKKLRLSEMDCVLVRDV